MIWQLFRLSVWLQGTWFSMDEERRVSLHFTYLVAKPSQLAKRSGMPNNLIVS